jgi:hypothetical protein
MTRDEIVREVAQALSAIPPEAFWAENDDMARARVAVALCFARAAEIAQDATVWIEDAAATRDDIVARLRAFAHHAENTPQHTQAAAAPQHSPASTDGSRRT